MKGLIYSNAPFSSTGYGIQTRHQCRMFQDLGHELAVAANNGLSSGMIRWRDIPLFPRRQHPYGFDVLRYYADTFGADFVLTLYDPWIFNQFAGGFREFVGRTWIAQTPIDGAPIRGPVLNTLRGADYVVTYSKFGHDTLERAGLPSTYIPHCIDTDVFKPGDKAAAKREIGLSEGTFMATVVGMNKDVMPSRKSWPEILRAWAQFSPTVEDCVLYCHTTKNPYLLSQGDAGFKFEELIDDLGIPPEKISFPSSQAMAVGISDEQMAMIYQASDVLLLPSMAEGFGLPIIEAQSCGTPVITIDAHTGPELTKYGWITKPENRVWIPGRAYYWARADIIEIFKALNAVYDNRGGKFGMEFGMDAHRWVVENYSIEAVKPLWESLLDRVEAESW